MLLRPPQMTQEKDNLSHINTESDARISSRSKNKVKKKQNSLGFRNKSSQPAKQFEQKQKDADNMSVGSHASGRSKKSKKKQSSIGLNKKSIPIMISHTPQKSQDEIDLVDYEQETNKKGRVPFQVQHSEVKNDFAHYQPQKFYQPQESKRATVDVIPIKSQPKIRSFKDVLHGLDSQNKIQSKISEQDIPVFKLDQNTSKDKRFAELVSPKVVEKVETRKLGQLFQQNRRNVQNSSELGVSINPSEINNSSVIGGSSRRSRSKLGQLFKQRSKDKQISNQSRASVNGFWNENPSITYIQNRNNEPFRKETGILQNSHSRQKQIKNTHHHIPEKVMQESVQQFSFDQNKSELNLSQSRNSPYISKLDNQISNFNNKDSLCFNIEPERRKKGLGLSSKIPKGAEDEIIKISGNLVSKQIEGKIGDYGIPSSGAERPKVIQSYTKLNQNLQQNEKYLKESALNSRFKQNQLNVEQMRAKEEQIRMRQLQIEKQKQRLAEKARNQQIRIEEQKTAHKMREAEWNRREDQRRIQEQRVAAEKARQEEEWKKEIRRKQQQREQEERKLDKLRNQQQKLKDQQQRKLQKLREEQTKIQNERKATFKKEQQRQRLKQEQLENQRVIQKQKEQDRIKAMSKQREEQRQRYRKQMEKERERAQKLEKEIQKQRQRQREKEREREQREREEKNLMHDQESERGQSLKTKTKEKSTRAKKQAIISNSKEKSLIYELDVGSQNGISNSQVNQKENYFSNIPSTYSKDNSERNSSRSFSQDSRKSTKKKEGVIPRNTTKHFMGQASPRAEQSFYEENKNYEEELKHESSGEAPRKLISFDQHQFQPKSAYKTDTYFYDKSSKALSKPPLSKKSSNSKSKPKEGQISKKTKQGQVKISPTGPQKHGEKKLSLVELAMKKNYEPESGNEYQSQDSYRSRQNSSASKNSRNSVGSRGSRGSQKKQSIIRLKQNLHQNRPPLYRKTSSESFEHIMTKAERHEKQITKKQNLHQAQSKQKNERPIIIKGCSFIDSRGRLVQNSDMIVKNNEVKRGRAHQNKMTEQRYFQKLRNSRVEKRSQSRERSLNRSRASNASNTSNRSRQSTEKRYLQSEAYSQSEGIKYERSGSNFFQTENQPFHTNYSTSQAYYGKTNANTKSPPQNLQQFIKPIIDPEIQKFGQRKSEYQERQTEEKKKRSIQRTEKMRQIK